MGKGTRAVAGKQKASVIELFVDNSKIVAKLNIANQRKKLWLLAGVGSGQKKVLMAQRNQRFFLSTWNFYLRETMFVKVTLRDAKEDVDEVCIEVQKLLTTQVENLIFAKKLVVNWELGTPISTLLIK